jgi:hypothetical protein
MTATTESMGQVRARLIVSLNQLEKKRRISQTEEEKDLAIQIKTLTQFGVENGLLYPQDMKMFQV